MRFIVPCKPFNTAIKSMKNVLKPKDWRRMVQRIYFQVFSTAPSVYYFRVMATDGLRLHETVIPVKEMIKCDTTCVGSFDVPRLTAKTDVEIDVDPDRVIIAFDEVTFTYRTPKIDPKEEDVVNNILDHVRKMQTVVIQKEGRISTSCNPQYLLEAAQSFVDCKIIRIDIGGAQEPLVIAGEDATGSKIFRMVMPMRTVVSDQTYRDNMGRRFDKPVVETGPASSDGPGNPSYHETEPGNAQNKEEPEDGK